jgi:hypothetical protein
VEQPPAPLRVAADACGAALAVAHLVERDARLADDVPLVDDEFGIGQDGENGLFVRPPHVDGDDLDGLPVGQSRQPPLHLAPVHVVDQVEQPLVAVIHEDGPLAAQQRQFVDTHEQRRSDLALGHGALETLIADVSDRLLIDADSPGDVCVGAHGPLVFDVIDAPLRHAAARIHVGQRLHGCFIAFPAAETLNAAANDKLLPESRGITVLDSLDAMAVKPAHGAAFRAGVQQAVIRRRGLLRAAGCQSTPCQYLFRLRPSRTPPLLARPRRIKMPCHRYCFSRQVTSSISMLARRLSP